MYESGEVLENDKKVPPKDKVEFSTESVDTEVNAKGSNSVDTEASAEGSNSVDTEASAEGADSVDTEVSTVNMDSVDPESKNNTGLIDKYFKSANNEDEVDIPDDFELYEFEYQSSKYDVADEDYDSCVDVLDDHGYVILSAENDRMSKYFANMLLQHIDQYGKMYKNEVAIRSIRKESRIAFIDFDNYINTLEDEHLVVIDICKFNRYEKEFFLQSFQSYILGEGNKVRYREQLLSKKMKLIFISYERDVEDINRSLSTFPVVQNQTALEDKKDDNIDDSDSLKLFFDGLEDDEFRNTLLLISALFPSITPDEFQEVLFLALDDEEKLLWRKQRKSLLKLFNIVSKKNDKGMNTLSFSPPFDKMKNEIIEYVQDEDPFFIIEFFTAFKEDKKLMESTLKGEQSEAFIDGFFNFVKIVVLDNPEFISPEWIIKQLKEVSDPSIGYFSSLGSIAMLIAQVKDDESFLEKLVIYFYERGDLWPLYYFTEYFSVSVKFDKFKWYKVILSSISEKNEGRELLKSVYKTIQKEVETDPNILEIILSWIENKKEYLKRNTTYIIFRLASDSVRFNKNWQESPLPFLFDENQEGISNAIEAYLLYVFNLQNEEILNNTSFPSNMIDENINKLFFMKVMGLQRKYGLEKEEQHLIFNKCLKEISSLFQDKQNFLITLLLFEWYFSLECLLDDKLKEVLEQKLFSTFIVSIDRKEYMWNKTIIVSLERLYLKLASLTRRHKKLSEVYTQLRRDMHSFSIQVNKSYKISTKGIK